MTDSELFRPDWVSAPGNTIADILQQRGMSRREFAKTIGTSLTQAQGLLTGRERITRSVAEQLHAVLGGSIVFWTNREKRYRDGIQELERQADEDMFEGWLKDLPVADMMRFQWMPEARTRNEKAAACLSFFGVGSVQAWLQEYGSLANSAVFRTSRTLKSKPGSVAAWLRRGELESGEIHCDTWSPKRLRQALPDLRALTRQQNPSVFIPALRNRLAKCGVAVVVLRAPSGCRASGAARFLTDHKALMLLSFRYLSDDQFWFSVFHEVGHLLLHPNQIFVDAPGMPSNNEEEEANQFAADSLVPPEHQVEMMKLPVDGKAVMRFARRIGIAPGIVVGQLQHRGRLLRRQLNNLKRRYAWREN